MKRTLRYALVAVLGSVIIAPAMAQDNFPDVPENHWAFEALARLKRDGILVGYPDGLFRGGRPASRYELAVAIHAVYQNLKNITDGLSSQIEELKKMPTGSGADVQSLRDALTGMQNDVAALKNAGDLATVRRLVEGFQKELQAMGVDVEAMKKDLNDLSARVDAIDKRLPVTISGDVNLWVGAGHSTDDRPGMNRDGRLIGVRKRANGSIDSRGGLTDDLTILHEGAISLSNAHVTEGPQWKATFVAGNMLAPSAFNNQASFGGNQYFEGSGDVYIQEFSVKFGSALAGLGFNAEIGRIGYSINPLVFERPDKTSYYANERWDSGEWMFDGAILNFNFGAIKLDLFGGRNSNRLSTNGQEISPMVVGADLNGVGGNLNNSIGSTATGPNFRVGTSLGANVNVPLGSAGGVNLSYLVLAADATTAIINLTGASNFADRLDVLGATANYKFGSIGVAGGYAQTNWMLGSDTSYDDNNTAWYGKVSYDASSWGVYGKYAEIGVGYAAPGNWGSIATISNPVNVKGFVVGGHVNFGALKLSGMGQFWEGLSNGAPASSWDTDTKLEGFKVQLDYMISPMFGASLYYEDSKVKDWVGQGSVGDLSTKFYGIGFSHGLSDNAKLMINYEINDVENFVFTSFNGSSNFKGGFLTTQLSLKF
jgi:hypothetical protein